jgi:hypothetical protein
MNRLKIYTNIEITYSVHTVLSISHYKNQLQNWDKIDNIYTHYYLTQIRKVIIPSINYAQIYTYGPRTFKRPGSTQNDLET